MAKRSPLNEVYASYFNRRINKLRMEMEGQIAKLESQQTQEDWEIATEAKKINMYDIMIRDINTKDI